MNQLSLEVPEETIQRESLLQRTKTKVKNFYGRMVSGTRIVLFYIKRKLFTKKQETETV